MVSRKKEIPSSLDLLPLGERFGDKNKARQRARPNDKFKHIKSSIDTGKKSLKALLDPKDQAKLTKMKGENYGRIAPQTLADYIEAGAKAERLDQRLNDIQVLRNGRYPTKRPPAETSDPKILLLDLRSAEEFAVSHIKNSLSFPAVNIQRDLVFSKLSIFKNRVDKMVVVYHEDERQGILASRIIYEKGFDNLYLLSGGFCIFGRTHPEYIENPTQPSERSFENLNAAGAMAAAITVPPNLSVPNL